MNKTLKIAKQEFRMTAANKAFVIITILGPFLILAMAVLPSLLAMTPSALAESTVIAAVGSDAALTAELNKSLAYMNFSLVNEASEAEARELVVNGKMSGYLRIPADYATGGEITYFSKTGTDMIIFETVKAVLGKYIVNQRMLEKGIDPELVAALSEDPNIRIRKIAGESVEEEGGFMTIMMTGIAFIMLIYMTVLLYGQLIARSVVTEKTAKTVEILLSSVTPRQILFGKILGIGFAGLLQYVIWIGIALLLVTVVGPAVNIAPPAAISPQNLLMLLVFFLVAYFLYASAYAALGAAAEDERHVSQLGLPLIIFLVIPMVMVSTLIMNPGSLVVKVMSFFPMTAQVVMFARVLVDPPPVWEILVSLGISLATIMLFVAGAAKIFRVGILMTGKRFKLIEILKWLRVK